MFFFDSHCHLYDLVYSHDINNVLDRAIKQGVCAFTLVGTNYKTSLMALKLAEKYKTIFATIGFHPHYANNCNINKIKILKKISFNKNIVAWGEIGLDYNRMYSSVKDQEYFFLYQLETADDLNLPIVLHERDTNGRLIDILKYHYNSNRNAVVHCFSGTFDELKEYLDFGYYIGITGIICMLKRGLKLRELIKKIPLDRILLETDSPYLTPIDQKNKTTSRNEPSFLINIFFKLVEFFDINPKNLKNMLWENTCDFYNINSINLKKLIIGKLDI